MPSSAFHHRLHRKRHLIKSFKEKANANRTFAERLADFMTVRFGSIFFLVLNILLFLMWFILNIEGISPLPIFDPYPFGLLTVVVSLEAIFLAIFVLISQNRANKIADFREEVALQIDTIAEEEISKMIELQILSLKKQGVDVSKEPTIQRMSQTEDIAEIEKSLEKQLF